MNFSELFKALNTVKDSRVLVVDDEEFCISTVQLLLRLNGVANPLQVDYCLNGNEAIEKVQELAGLGLTYKLILIDFSMPIMDGI